MTTKQTGEVICNKCGAAVFGAWYSPDEGTDICQDCMAKAYEENARLTAALNRVRDLIKFRAPMAAIHEIEVALGEKP